MRVDKLDTRCSCCAKRLSYQKLTSVENKLQNATVKSLRNAMHFTLFIAVFCEPRCHKFVTDLTGLDKFIRRQDSVLIGTMVSDGNQNQHIDHQQTMNIEPFSSDSLSTLRENKLDHFVALHHAPTNVAPPKKRRRLFDSLVLCKKSSKIKPSISKANVAVTKSSAELDTSAQFCDVKPICYFKRIAANKDKDCKLKLSMMENVLLNGKSRIITIHQDHCINKWYMVSGGSVIVYQGVKQIEISSQTIITPVEPQRPPKVDFKNVDNIVTEFENLKTLAQRFPGQLYIGAYVDEIGKEQARGKYRVIVLTLRDINGIGINVNLWHEQDRDMAEKIKINNTIVLTGWKLNQTPTLSVNNNGMLFINQELPKAAKTSRMIKN